MGIWSAEFSNTMNAILNTAETDLQTIGFGTIDRGEMSIGLSGSNIPTVSLELCGAWQRREHRGQKRIRVYFKNEWVDGRSDEFTNSFNDRLNLAHKNLAVVELADRWVRRWGSLRWSEANVYDADELACERAEYEHELAIADAVAGLTRRRREVLEIAGNRTEMSAADRRVAKSIPELLDNGLLTDLGREVLAKLKDKEK